MPHKERGQTHQLPHSRRTIERTELDPRTLGQDAGGGTQPAHRPGQEGPPLAKNDGANPKRRLRRRKGHKWSDSQWGSTHTHHRPRVTSAHNGGKANGSHHERSRNPPNTLKDGTTRGKGAFRLVTPPRQSNAHNSDTHPAYPLRRPSSPPCPSAPPWLGTGVTHVTGPQPSRR